MRVKIRYVVLFSFTTFMVLTGIFVGHTAFTITEIMNGLTRSGEDMVSTIVWDVRIPRVLVSLLVGGCLGLSGVLIQLSTKSPLGDPNLFGIGGGAAVFLAMMAAGILVFGSLGIVIGSILCSVFVALLFSKLISVENISPIRIAIIGIAVGSLTIALGTSVVSHSRVFPTQILGLVSGSFTASDWISVYYLSVTLVICTISAFLLSRRFYPMILGDVLSRSLGVNPHSTRTYVMVLAGGLAGVSVYAGGLVGFVGLMSPHIARRIFGHSPSSMIIGSLWIGSLATIFADQFARLIFAPMELPVGMVTTAMGAPIMMYLALKIR
tara:strand:- start:540 stop:1511 length:972 start_codon:yes stop_codon:yes gene_type:complete